MIRLDSEDFSQNAHAHLKSMRENNPVCETRFAGRKTAWLITRYEDVKSSLKDERIIKNPNNAKSDSGKTGNFWMPKTFRPLMKNMLNSDEPDHRRLRNLVHKAFTPGMIAGLEPKIQSITDDLLTKAIEQREVDLIEAFALPLPVTVIAEMIGVPEADRPRFFGWTRKIIVSPTPVNMLLAVPPLMAMMKYLRKLAEQRKADPQDDLLTALVQAEDEQGDRFTEDELLAMVFILLVAGHETTVGLISNGTHALLTNPDQLDLLKSDFSIIETAVEELLRYDGPLISGELSFAKQDIEWHGVTIPRGEVILSAILSANRDGTEFENPDQLDLTRTPNRHLAFGHGIHYCLGAPLARLEAKIAFTTLLQRCPELQFQGDPQELKYQAVMMLHRHVAMPVKL